MQHDKVAGMHVAGPEHITQVRMLPNMARGKPLIAMQWANADSSDGSSDGDSGSGSGSGSDSESGNADSDVEDGPAVSGSGAAASPSAAAAGRGRSSGQRPKHKRRKGTKILKQGQKRQLQRMEISDASDDGAGGDSDAESEPASDAGVASSNAVVHSHRPGRGTETTRSDRWSVVLCSGSAPLRSPCCAGDSPADSGAGGSDSEADAAAASPASHAGAAPSQAPGSRAPGSRAAADVKRRRRQGEKRRKSAPVPPPPAASDGGSSDSAMQLAAEEASDVEPVRGASPTAAAAADGQPSAERGSRQDKRHEVRCGFSYIFVISGEKTIKLAARLLC